MATATRQRVRLGDLLVQRGVITDEQLAAALAAQQRGSQQRLIGEILVDLGYATKEQVLSAVSASCGVPFARLVPQLVDPAVRNALPESFIQKHGVLPLFKIRDMITVATSEPSNLFLVDEMVHAAGLRVQLVAATPDNIYQMIEHTLADRKGQPPGDEAAADASTLDDVVLSEDFDTVYGSWPPEKVATLLVREAVRARASVIHLEPDEKVLRIRFGIDGALHVVMRPPVRLAAGLVGAFDEMTGPGGRGASGPEVRRSARLLVQGRAVQLQIASMGGAFGPCVTVRLVRDDEAHRPLEKLGFDFELLARYRKVIEAGHGLVLVAGPRASGITTTLYSTLNALDPIRLNIRTLESCVHFNLPGVNQFSPATCGMADPDAALARLLAQQPDVLVLDCEVSDAAAKMAAEAARDGCLVLAQVRAIDAADALARLSARVPADILGVALKAVLAQRLVRAVCTHCRSSHEPPADLRRQIADAFGPVEQYIKGRGCAHCARTGLAGQIGLFELVPLEGHLAELLAAPRDHRQWRAAVRAAKCPSLWVDGVNKIRAGITSLEEVMAVLSGCPGEMLQPEPAPAAAAAGRPGD